MHDCATKPWRGLHETKKLFRSNLCLSTAIDRNGDFGRHFTHQSGKACPQGNAISLQYWRPWLSRVNLRRTQYEHISLPLCGASGPHDFNSPASCLSVEMRMLHGT